MVRPGWLFFKLFVTHILTERDTVFLLFQIENLLLFEYAPYITFEWGALAKPVFRKGTVPKPVFRKGPPSECPCYIGYRCTRPQIQRGPLFTDYVGDLDLW